MNHQTSCPILETPRLILHPIELADADPLFDMWSADGFAELGGFELPSHELVKVNVAHFVNLNEAGLYRKWAVRLKETHEFLGECELYPIKPQIHPWLEWGVGYSLKQAAWRQGYMTEALGKVLDYAFNDMQVLRVKADVAETNARSLQLLTRLGFQQEGLQRSKNIANQVSVDLLLLAHTRERFNHSHINDA